MRLHRFSALFLFLLILPAFSKTKYQPLPVRLDRNGEKWAEKTREKLSLEEKVGQLFMIWTRAQFLNVNSPEYAQLRDHMNRYHVGSFAVSVPYDPPFLYKTGPYEAAQLLNRLQHDSKLPLLIAADFELGLSNRMNGATAFPNAMAIGATGRLDYAEKFGRITAQEARAIGVHWNFFPVADVNSNPDNPIINTRSFGGDAQQVGDFVSAYIRPACWLPPNIFPGTEIRQRTRISDWPRLAENARGWSRWSFLLFARRLRQVSIPLWSRT